MGPSKVSTEVRRGEFQPELQAGAEGRRLLHRFHLTGSELLPEKLQQSASTSCHSRIPQRLASPAHVRWTYRQAPRMRRQGKVAMRESEECVEHLRAQLR